MITTELKTHAIVTHSGAHYFISQQQNENLRNVGLNDLFEIEGNKIKGSSIAEVMTLEKYYETYPQKKQEFLGQPAKDETYFRQEGHVSIETLDKLKELKNKILGKRP